MASGSGYWGKRRRSEGLKGKSSAKTRRAKRSKQTYDDVDYFF